VEVVGEAGGEGGGAVILPLVTAAEFGGFLIACVNCFRCLHNLGFFDICKWVHDVQFGFAYFEIRVIYIP
jgi:hypothetical protein